MSNVPVGGDVVVVLALVGADVVALFASELELLSDAVVVISAFSVETGNVVSGISSHIHSFFHVQSLLMSSTTSSFVPLDDVLLADVLLDPVALELGVP